MRSLIGELPLDGSFDIEIDDFLFEEAPLIPLASTPQPIVAAQVQAPETGQTKQLTRTQEALLSPEEKVIASRT